MPHINQGLGGGGGVGPEHEAGQSLQLQGPATNAVVYTKRTEQKFDNGYKVCSSIPRHEFFRSKLN